MSIVVTCACGQSSRAKPELAGRRVKCPRCGSVLQIPQPTQPVQPTQPLPPLGDPNDPLGLGGFNEQAMGAPLPQMPGPQPLQSTLPTYTAPKQKKDWGPIIRIGLIGGGVAVGIGVVVVGVVILLSFIGKYRSPEAVFQAAKKAAEKEDWEDLCKCLTSESRDQLAGMMVFAGMMMKGASGLAALAGPEKVREVEEKLKPITDVLEKHGLDDETLENMKPQGRMMPGRVDDDRLQEWLAPVKNRNKFVGDMFAAAKQVGEQEGSLPTNWETNAKWATDAKLEDLETGEDSATGYVVYTKNGNERRDKIAFKKEDGSWKIDILGSVRR